MLVEERVTGTADGGRESAMEVEPEVPSQWIEMEVAADWGWMVEGVLLEEAASVPC